MGQCMSYLDFKKVYDSVKREVFYDIVLGFGIPKKVVRLIKMFLKIIPVAKFVYVNICLIHFLFRMA